MLVYQMIALVAIVLAFIAGNYFFQEKSSYGNEGAKF